MSQQPLVSILCATYNQKKYIAQCIEGFLCQKVNFPIEIIIHDDASTDGTADIVREYANKHPDLIKPILQTENQHSKHNSIWKNFIYPKAQGKYYAECEGDDYWTDPNKLQRQVDFLECHPDYVLSTENANILFTKTGVVKPFSTEQEHNITQDDLLICRRFATASVVYQGKYVAEFLRSDQPSFDTCFWAYLSSKGKIHFSPIISSVYRRGPGVTENNKVKWAYTSEQFNNTINQFYNPSKKVRKARNKTLFFDFRQGWKAAKVCGDKVNARKLLFKMIKLSPKFFIEDYLKRKYQFYVNEKIQPALANLKIKLASTKKRSSSERSNPIVVSLTSYEPRFKTLHLCIKSLLNQSFSADKVILYLTKDIEISSLPKNLQMLQSKGLEIRNICENIKPHKKYFYAMQEFKDSIIVTADDDVIYPKNWLESLYDSYKMHPSCISARRVHKISRCLDGSAAPYNTWTLEYRGVEPSMDLVGIGVGGVLYPPHIFDMNKEYFKKENIISNALNADDIWLKFMELEENVPVVWVPCKTPHPYKIDDPALAQTGLENENRLNNQNDIYIKNCEKFFKKKL